MDIKYIVKLYNDDGLSLIKIGEKLGTSKSSVSRLLTKEGYVLDKTIKKYVCKSINTKSNATVDTKSNATVNTENNKTVNTENNKTVKCSFDLSSNFYKALKIKSAIDGVKMVDIVKMALSEYIEDKYFDM